MNKFSKMKVHWWTCCGQWPNNMDKYVRTGTSALY